MNTNLKSYTEHLNAGQIAEVLVATHEHFWSYLYDLKMEEYEFSKDGEKWNAGQQAHHILKSCEALLKVLWLPRFLMKRQFGVANRPSRTPAELVSRYDERLAQVDSRTTPFLADGQTYKGRQSLLKRCRAKSESIGQKFSRFSEEKLDQLVVPHPLLGKVTLREMGYFFIHHVQHHHSGTIDNLKSKRLD